MLTAPTRVRTPMKLHGLQTDQQLNDLAHRYLDRFFGPECQADLATPVINDPTEQQLKNLAAALDIPAAPQDPEKVVATLTADLFPLGFRVNDPHFVGFVPAPSSRVSWLGELIATSYNRFGGTYRNFPGGALIERTLIEWLAAKAGFGAQASGLFVSGGSMANLTALIAARDKHLTPDDLPKGVAYVSSQTHSSVAKALRVAGISPERIRVIPVDERFRMDTATLEAALNADKDAGLLPFAVIASAGTTNTGSVDPLREIARICGEHKVWMHVDGAFGASLLLSRSFAHLLDGIELANSLSWDAHKWLYQTFGCGIVLVRDRSDLLASFSAHPEYLNDLDLDSANYDAADLGIELTRPSRGLKLWFTLQLVGTNELGVAIDRAVESGMQFEELITLNPCVELVSPAQMGVVNFRYAPSHLNEEQRDRLNQEISRAILEEGQLGLFTTELCGHKVLRVCLLHPSLTDDDLRAMVSAIDEHANRLIPLI